MNHITQKVTALVMALILLTMQESLVRYRHAHLLADGSVVWHSHPFGDGQHSPGGKTHQHSPGNQFAFDQLSQSLPVAVRETTVPGIKTKRLTRHKTPRRGSFTLTRRSAHQLRAPPAAATGMAA